MRPVTAIVMNMFHTGLGVARSLGKRGIPVIGLSSHRACGNFTRCARVFAAPDSREEPEQLLEFLLNLRPSLKNGGIIFPTRDDDVVFLDRFREKLQRFFRLVLPESGPLGITIDKWKTAHAAQAAGVSCPRTWHIESRDDLLAKADEFRFPCVLKPVAAHHWRRGSNWQLVGSRKAIRVQSWQEMYEEYGRIRQADSRVLIQEMVPGGDECLFIAGCYMNRNATFLAGFTAQKLVQSPAGFGTGCIVQAIECPELLETARRFLEGIDFSGIAEVEFKRDPDTGEYKLIEINPRPWDQHMLGNACGVDVIYLAYCDFAGLALPCIASQTVGERWIAEDVFSWLFLRSVWRHNGEARKLLRMFQGRRVYSVWSLGDPLPFFGFLVRQFIPDLIALTISSLWARGRGQFGRPGVAQ